MPARSDEPLLRVCIRPFEADYEYLRRVAHAKGLKLNLLLRSIINSYTNQLREKEARLIPDPSTLHITITDEELDQILADAEEDEKGFGK